MGPTPFSLYLHFPYCAHRCPYCDFNVHVRKEVPEKEYVQAILTEARQRLSEPEWEGRPVSSIFFGGGTPSLLSSSALSEILEGLAKYWTFTSDLEFTLESNPESVDQQKLVGFQQAGVNRLSIGIQSFSDDALRALGRNHDRESAIRAFRAARKAGFANINIDLMHSLPKQTLQHVELDCEQVLELQPEHISYYSLGVEVGTAFHSKLAAGKLELPGDDQSAEAMLLIKNCLESAGFNQYEVSNFARQGFECRHNLGYWNLQDYLGLGPGAHSAYSEHRDNRKQLTRRWANKSFPEYYLKDPIRSVGWREVVKGSQLAFETIFLGLRQCAGIEVHGIFSGLTEDQSLRVHGLIRQLREEDFLQNSTTHLALSPRGVMIADAINERFSQALLG